MNTFDRVRQPNWTRTATGIVIAVALGGLALWLLQRADPSRPGGPIAGHALPEPGNLAPEPAIAGLESTGAELSDLRQAVPLEPEAAVSEATQPPEDPGAPPDEAEAEAAQFAAKYAGLTRGQLQVRMDKIQDQLRIEVNQAADALLAAGRFEVKQGEFDPDTGGYWFRGSGLENLHKQYSIEGDISRMKRVEMSPTEFQELYRFQSELNWLATQIFRSR